jgi:hypothetical protein
MHWDKLHFHNEECRNNSGKITFSCHICVTPAHTIPHRAWVYNADSEVCYKCYFLKEEELYWNYSCYIWTKFTVQGLPRYLVGQQIVFFCATRKFIRPTAFARARLRVMFWATCILCAQSYFTAIRTILYTGLAWLIIMGSGFDHGFIGTSLQLQSVITAHTLNPVWLISDWPEFNSRMNSLL